MDSNSIGKFHTALYSVGQLFGDGMALIIPDMQRDYCWDDDKVEALIDGILSLFRKNQSAILGLVYGYEHPYGSHRVHVIDGQQRLTTFYLLLGMAYRRAPEPWIRDLLVSDVNFCEPKLLYQSKRESFYFLSELVEHFFLNRDGRLSQLELSDWYFSSYADDPSVQCFIRAIRAIDRSIENALASAWIDFTALARFISSDIRFLFCNLNNRTEAERAFITINTTADPLDLAENLRYLTIAMSDDPAQTALLWNDIEDWCWRQSHSADMIASIINLFGDYAQIKGDDSNFGAIDYKTMSEDISRRMFSEFVEFFRSYRILADALGFAPLAFPVIPTIDYMLRFPNCGKDNVLRFWRYLENIARYQRPVASDSLEACKLAQSLPDADILSILKQKRANSRFINDEEIKKLEFVRANIDRRDEIEAMINKGQSHPLLNGRLSSVIDWCLGAHKSPADSLAEYIDAIYSVWGDDIDKNEELDIVRRALLTIRLKGYPIIRRGDVMYSLCWNDYDWQRLLSSSPGLVRTFIERCVGGKASPQDAMKEMIKRFSDRSTPYYIIIKNGETLKSCRKRQFMRPCAPFIGFYDTSLQRMRWFVDQLELLQVDGWKEARGYGSRCIYSDHESLNAAIDLYYLANDKYGTFKIELFARPENVDYKPTVNLNIVVNVFGNTYRYDKKRHRFVAYCPDAKRALWLIKQTMFQTSTIS